MRRYLPIWVIAVMFVGGGLWAGWLGQRHMAGTGSLIDRVETVLLDWRILAAGARDAPGNIVVVAVDDATITAIGANSIGREQLALLIEKIASAGARALAIDMLLTGSSGHEADDRLVKALGKIPTVIASAGQFSNDGKPHSPIPVADELLLPEPAFAAVAAVGLVNIATDAGGTPRHIPLLFRTPGGLFPSLALRALGFYLGEPPSLTGEGLRLKDDVLTLDLGWHLPLNYYGPSGTVKTVSALALLDGSVEVADLEGRLVVLGVTATAVGDRFGTPFDQILPGVELQATGIANLLDGSALIRNNTIRSVDAGAAVLMTGIGILCVSLLPLAVASMVFMCLLGGWLAATFFFFGQGYWLSAALPLVASIPPVLALVILRQGVDRYQTRRLVLAQEALSRFQAPVLAKRIAEDPDFLLAPKEQDMAVLFVDLSGFTGLSERLGPARTRDVLKAFHTLVVNETERHNGLVLDFMGDGAMLAFGIPDVRPRNAADACQCAFDLAKAVKSWIDASGLATEISDVRVGGHFGTVVLSRLGHENQQQITATGDNVNVASRLLEVAKGQRSSVALSLDLIQAASTSGGVELSVPHIETSTIRGRQKTLEIGLWTMPELLACREELSRSA